MSWPSKRVPYGGILHPAKATYSAETHKFLRGKFLYKNQWRALQFFF